MPGRTGAVHIPLPHRRAGHCGSGAYRDLLEFHGLSWGPEPLSEGMAFGLGAGLGFAYVGLPGVDPPLYMVGRTADLERDVCEHLGIGLDMRQTDDRAEGWAWLKAELDAVPPVEVTRRLIQMKASHSQLPRPEAAGRSVAMPKS